MNPDRVRVLKEGDAGPGPVVYWMSRDQRVKDNWALIYAQQEALFRKRPLVVVFCLAPHFLGAALRQYAFMLKGLEETSRALAEREIGFFLLRGRPESEVSGFVNQVRAALIVTDFDPLRIKQQWKKGVSRKIRSPFHEVDAHNIVPCWLASPKQEFGAYTLRPKIHRRLPDFLQGFPSVQKHPYPLSCFGAAWTAAAVLQEMTLDRGIGEVSGLIPGEKAGRRALRAFIRERLSGYSQRRNDPARDGQSGLSPYFHFGQLSPQRAALEVSQSHAPRQDQEAFLEELVIRRELSDNFCFYNPDYDSWRCVPSWARKTLEIHAGDQREYSYTLRQFEKAETHDLLWNAAQTQMVCSGKMHGYLRMYWAKKILEWTPSVEKAWKIAVYLNDTYELDGRDPNGYAGIAWCLGGVHDRAWGERTVFGKIRYMNAKGCRSKFQVEDYIKMVSLMKEGA